MRTFEPETSLACFCESRRRGYKKLLTDSLSSFFSSSSSSCLSAPRLESLSGRCARPLIRWGGASILTTWLLREAAIAQGTWQKQLEMFRRRMLLRKNENIVPDGNRENMMLCRTHGQPAAQQHRLANVRRKVSPEFQQVAPRSMIVAPTLTPNPSQAALKSTPNWP